MTKKNEYREMRRQIPNGQLCLSNLNNNDGNSGHINQNMVTPGANTAIYGQASVVPCNFANNGTVNANGNQQQQPQQQQQQHNQPLTPSFSAGGFIPLNARVTTQATSNQVTPRGHQFTTRGPVSGVATTIPNNTQFMQGSAVAGVPHQTPEAFYCQVSSGGGVSGATPQAINAQILQGGGRISRATPQAINA